MKVGDILSTGPQGVAPGQSRGVQSADTVLLILNAFCRDDYRPMLKTIAAIVDMHPAKVHRYLVSLCRSGFVEQESRTGRYRLGPAALQLAFMVRRSDDPVDVLRPFMAGFGAKLQHSLALCMWSANGPVISVLETLPGNFAVTVRESDCLSILTSAVGAVFTAFLPASSTAPLIDRELRDHRGRRHAREELEAVCASVRQRGLARTTNRVDAGTHSLAAPIFDATGQIVAVLCTLGIAASFDSKWTSQTAQTLRDCARRASIRLGYITE